MRTEKNALKSETGAGDELGHKHSQHWEEALGPVKLGASDRTLRAG